MQVTDADMPLSSPALISCQHFKLRCSYSSETSLFLHWLGLIYSTKTQWVCLKDADPPLTFLNSVGFKSNPQGEHLFLTAHQGWSNTPVASAGSYMNRARGWYCGRVLSKKGQISKWLFSRMDQDRHLLNGGEMCSAVKGKLAGEVPEQARLQREIHSKASPIKPFWVRRARSP